MKDLCRVVMQNFLELVKRRRSVRSYQKRKIPREMVHKCLRAAAYAPTACGKRSVRIIITEGKIKDELVDKALGIVPVRNAWAKEAPVIAVFAVDRDIITHRIAPAISRVRYDFIDVGIAGEHFALQAAELGLGTCWIVWFKVKKAAGLLGLPFNWKVESMMALGFPADQPPVREEKKTLEGFLFMGGDDD